MSQVFLILMLVAMGATVLSLVMGLVVMIKGGALNEKYGNQLMRWRVTLQGLALLLFALAMLSAHQK